MSSPSEKSFQQHATSAEKQPGLHQLQPSGACTSWTLQERVARSPCRPAALVVAEFFFIFTYVYILSFVMFNENERNMYIVFIIALMSQGVGKLWKKFRSWRMRVTSRDEETMIGSVGGDEMSDDGAGLESIRLGKDGKSRAEE
ncbi:hypothetical protein CC77DRAFT_1065848 [Alternaria alternata]|uniref:Uncharacterized protein n=1 Tax=Alternaria alternata TaxID=5599 RepID=A0A177D9L0_ALTAL|nr:hypothetical protein CC77DRAFT_1065848 [Alternaria alternata]OAG15792.1 hypothetical protein CC77DRAFT_1065848 [Alternaria alternata]RII12518.1 hypothetical protein CUC08_Gglean004635 [Alternaria sp. MG1]